AFAHAARTYRTLPDPGMQAYAATLESAARRAWAWLEANPGQIPSTYDNQGFMNSPAEDGAYEQSANRVCAAAYLYGLTGEMPFQDYVGANYAGVHLILWWYAYPWEASFQDCLLDYARQPGATPGVAD